MIIAVVVSDIFWDEDAKARSRVRPINFSNKGTPSELVQGLREGSESSGRVLKDGVTLSLKF